MAEKNNPSSPELDESVVDNTADQQSSDTEENRSAETGAGEDVETLKEELAAAKDQIIRLQAEMQNIRRRAQLDVEKAHKFGVEKLVRELLPVVDGLEKAIESFDGSEAAINAMRDGVEMTLSMLLKGMEKHAVEQLNPEGEPFDPEHHEAMSMVEAPDVEPNSVVNVVQKGYKLNGRLVRPAMVVVSKNAPKIDENA